MKKLLAMAIVAIATVAGSASSYAQCSQVLKIYRNAAVTGAANNLAYYYGVNESFGLPTVTWWFTVNELDEALNVAMDNAYANGLTVFVRANAANGCPAAGNFRFMGNAVQGQSYQLH